MAVNKHLNNNNTSGDGPMQFPLPLVIGGVVIALLLFLFMYHTFISPLYGVGPRRAERIAPPPGYPDVAPYNTREWQQHAKPGQRMPGVPPIDYSKQRGPAQ